MTRKRRSMVSFITLTFSIILPHKKVRSDLTGRPEREPVALLVDACDTALYPGCRVLVRDAMAVFLIELNSR